MNLLLRYGKIKEVQDAPTSLLFKAEEDRKSVV